LEKEEFEKLFKKEKRLLKKPKKSIIKTETNK